MDGKQFVQPSKLLCVQTATITLHRLYKRTTQVLTGTCNIMN